jgi:hypothetical protein
MVRFSLPIRAPKLVEWLVYVLHIAMSGRSFPVTTRSAILVPLATRQWSEMPPHVVPSYLCSYYELWCVDHRPIDLLCLLVLNTT